MNIQGSRDREIVPEEKPDSFWGQVYVAVLATTFVVITLLWAFSRYFS